MPEESSERWFLTVDATSTRLNLGVVTQRHPARVYAEQCGHPMPTGAHQIVVTGRWERLRIEQTHSLQLGQAGDRGLVEEAVEAVLVEAGVRWSDLAAVVVADRPEAPPARGSPPS